MDSNEHDAIEQNVEHHESNILIYYTRETKLYAESYDAMNKSLKLETLRSLVCMLVLVTTEITKIHGIHPWKDGMAYNKTHVELMPIRCTE